MNKETKQIIWANAYSATWLKGDNGHETCQEEADRVLEATQENFEGSQRTHDQWDVEIQRLKDLNFAKVTRISELENDRFKSPNAYKTLEIKVSELETERDRANNELATLSNAFREIHVRSDHKTLELKINNRNEEIKNLKRVISSRNDLAETQQGEISRLDQLYKQVNEQLDQEYTKVSNLHAVIAHRETDIRELKGIISGGEKMMSEVLEEAADNDRHIKKLEECNSGQLEVIRDQKLRHDVELEKIKELNQLIWDTGVKWAQHHIAASPKKYNYWMEFAEKGKNHD